MAPTPDCLRRRSTPFRATLAACFALAALAACKREEPPHAVPQAQAAAPQAAAPAAVAFRVTGIQLGNAIGADKKVTAPSASFKPSDTIYASILTDGAAPNAALGARWTFEDGQLVSEATQNIAPTGPAVTEFHISKPDGWPAGKYTVAVTANGAPAGSAQFTVAD